MEDEMKCTACEDGIEVALEKERQMLEEYGWFRF